MDESNRLNIKYRILLYETEKQFPIMEEFPAEQLEVIGYDYAYPGGSYYSCIYNDIVSERIPELKKYKLNKYGLFDTETQVKEFIHYRNELVKIYDERFFEKGDFVIYKISELKDGNDLENIFKSCIIHNAVN